LNDYLIFSGHDGWKPNADADEPGPDQPQHGERNGARGSINDWSSSQGPSTSVHEPQPWKYGSNWRVAHDDALSRVKPGSSESVYPIAGVIPNGATLTGPPQQHGPFADVGIYRNPAERHDGRGASLPGNYGFLRGKYHCTVDLLFDQFSNVHLCNTKFSAPNAKYISKPVKQEVNCTVILPL